MPDLEAVSLPPVVEGTPAETVSLPTPETNTLPPPPAIAAERGAKAAIGVGPLLNKTKDDLTYDMSTGMERHIRETAAAALDFKRDQQKMKTVREMAQRYGPLSSAQVAQILDPFAPQNANTNPDTVLEQQFAKSYIGSMATTPGFVGTRTVFDAAADIIPEQAAKVVDTANDLTAKNQRLLTKIQDAEHETSQQGWIDWTADFLKSATQIYPEAKQRGVVDGSYFKALGLGSDLDEQSNTLYRLPMDKFEEVLKRVDVVFKDNPQLKVSFLKAMHGQDVFEKTLQNVFTGMAIPDATLGAKLVKKVLTFNEINKAARDMASAAAKETNPTPANMAGAAGDVHESAVLQVANGVMSAIRGSADPIQTSRNALLTTWKEMADNFATNPGTNLSREEFTRIHDAIVKDGGKILETITQMNRVERNPQALTEDVIRAYKEKIKNDPAYRGPNSTVLDVDGPFIEPASNTKWFRIRRGDHDASLFADSETVKGRVEQEGFGQVGGKAPENIYYSEAAVKHLRPEGTGTTFKTSKGSTYTVEGETTVRDKAPRPEHPGEEGLQPKSEQTYYVTKEHLNELGLFQAEGGPKMALAETKDERLGVKYLEGKDKGKFEKRTVAKFEVEPKVGLYPVELWKKGTRVHFGNEITEVLPRTRLTEVKNGKIFTEHGIEVQGSPTPQAGMIPFNPKTNQFGKTLTEETAKIEQQGLGFYIEHWVPMRETDDFLRDLMIRDTKGNLVPETVSSSSASGTKSIINSVLGWVRNSEETLAFNESVQRKAVVYSQANVHRWAYELNKEVGKVINAGAWWKPTAYLGKVTGKQIQSQFERTLDYARQTEAWFKTPVDLEDFYLRSFNRKPSFLETKAYFNYVKLIEGDRMLGEIAEFRNRARVGAEQHRLRMIGSDGKPIYSKFFDGVTLSRLHINEDQIYISGDAPGKDLGVKTTQSLSTKQRKVINDDIQSGRAKLIEIYDQDHYPLDSFSQKTEGQRIRYVLTRNVESQPIEFNHVNKKEGGHFDWDYDHFIKQADMRQQASGKHIYVGDKTIMPVGSKALGRDLVKIWNEAQGLILEGKWEEVRPLAAKLGIPYEKFTGWYKATRNELGRPVAPKLNPNEPIQVVSKGKKISDIDDALQLRYRFKDQAGNPVNRFVDGSKSGLANNFKVAYNTERHTDFEYRTINDIGSKDNPIYAYQPAKLVDPLPTMNRALNRAINSAFMDDYKLYAIEHWLREAEHHMEVDGGVDAIRSSPFWYYNNPKFKRDTPANVKWNLMSNKYKVDTFVGVPSKFDTWVHTFTEHLANEAYTKYGPEANRSFGDKALTIMPIWLLHKATNPVDFIRGATFNFKLGLFNPAQFLVQAQTHALIWALEPQHGTAGTYAMLLHGWSKVNRNPAILNSLDNYATKLSGFGSRFRPGEFLEAQRELEKTGFEHVAGEYQNIASAYSPTTNFIKSDIQQGLRLGQTPFRLGEQSTRVTAWYTAFRKFREANPNIPITNIERGKILQEADLLTVNMSRASSSMINHGVFSLSTQFLNYQIKLAELFWSKRIDNMARMRILTGFSLLYGIPGAVGVTGAPVSDNIRASLIDDLGYIPGEKWWSTMINEGLPSWQLAMITGKGDIQKGNVENIADRYSSQGFQNLKQALRSDIPWYLAIGGAGITTAFNFGTAAIDPYWQGVRSWARGDTGDEKFTIKGADLIEPLKEASVANAAIKWWTAINSGKWIAKNEGYVTDVSQLRATFLALTGMNPQAQDDMFIKNNIIKAEEAAQKGALKEFIKDWGRSTEAFQNKDPEQGNAYVRNGIARFTSVGYPWEEILKAMAIGSRGYESAIESSDYSFWNRGDQSKQQQRMDLIMRQRQLDEKRK